VDTKQKLKRRDPESSRLRFIPAVAMLWRGKSARQGRLKLKIRAFPRSSVVKFQRTNSFVQKTFCGGAFMV
jgi:hypothetical protein